MSFSSEIKEEIIKQDIENDCCGFAFLAAAINAVGSLEIKREGITFSLRIDNVEVIKKVQSIINKLYSSKVEEINIKTQTTGKVMVNEVVFPLSVGSQILKDCMILSLNKENAWEIKKGIDHHIILEDCCKTTYLKTMFLCAGTISVPVLDEQTGQFSGGYHFEMEFVDAEQAKAVSHLLGEFGFITKKVERNNRFVVYMKEGESIADFVGFVGATKSYLSLQNDMITRDVRNSINRQANCSLANIGKTVGASLVQLKAIEVIKETIGIDNLPSDLAKYAYLRLNNPDSSLADLIVLSGENITKSGMNYKLKKIVEIANNL